MPEYVSIKDEATLIRELLLEKGDDYYLSSLVPDDNILLKEPEHIHQFPCVVVRKTTAGETSYVGDIPSESIQESGIQITISTRRNITKTYNLIEYKDESLVKLIRDIIKELMFQNRQYSHSSVPDTVMELNLLTTDAGGEGIVRVGPVYEITMLYSVTMRVVMT